MHSPRTEEKEIKMNAYSIKSNDEIYLPLDFKSNVTSLNGTIAQNQDNNKNKEQRSSDHQQQQFYIDYLNKTNNSNC